MSTRGVLYLIPTSLGADNTAVVLPAETLRIVATLAHFVVENPKTARQFLKQTHYPHPLQTVSMRVLDEHTREDDIAPLLEPLLAGHHCGLMSEAGCPGVADPGALMVRAAHDAGIRVVPLVGPSSILLALMASGLSGQQFVFHGYLPVAENARQNKLKELERQSEINDATQIFIETPYRNAVMLRALMESCRPDTLLCLAADLTLATESIATRTIAAWKKHSVDLNRRPAVFLLYRGRSRNQKR